MVLNPRIARDFLLDTDYPLDKIIYMPTGSFTIPAFSTSSDSITHNLQFTPLMDGTWSTAEGFSLSYDMGSGPPSTTSGFLFNLSLNVSANATNVVVEGTNITANPITVYYRIFGFEPSNVNLDAPFTSNSAGSYVLNTDYNYTKLYDTNVVTQTTSVIHGLGYLPQVAIWTELAGTITKKNDNDIFAGTILSVVSVSELTITFVSPPVGTSVHYRVYLDE